MFVFPKGHVYPIGARGFFLTQFMYQNQSWLTYLKCHCKYTTLNFLKFICEHFDARTNDHLFYKSAFLVFFFSKSCLKVGGAAYSRVRLIHEFLRYFKKGNFAQKRVLKLVEPFSGHCLATNSRLQVIQYTASWSRKRLASKVRACAECKISRFSLFRPSFAFLASSFVSSFVGQLVGYISLASVFWEALRS